MICPKNNKSLVSEIEGNQLVVMKIYFFIFLFLTSYLAPLSAEIQKVNLTWTAILCRGLCGRELEKQFSRVKGVASITINQQAGSAELRWKPNEKFSFQPIHIAMALVGLGLRDIRLTARGTIRTDGKTFTLVSIGDNTVFTLLNPIIPNPHSYVPQTSTANRKLTPEMQQKLFDAQRTHKIAIIEGPLFEPYRSPPLMLVIDQISFEEQPQEKKLLKKK